MTKKLFIIDAMAMAFRNYHAFGMRPLTTRNGLPTSAVFGSAQFILKIIEDEKPDYLMVASDSGVKNFRHELYPAYKAHRTEMPEDLKVQLPYLFKLFSALGLRTMMQQGVEADDLIGSIVTQLGNEALQCFIVSGDKDFAQLINSHTFLYIPQKGGAVKVLDRAGTFEKFGCYPEEIRDYLALIGDSSDNVPGVKGIGEKGAAKLIAEYKSLEGIFANLASIKNAKLQSSLKDSQEIAFLSRQLVDLKKDITLDFHLEMLQCRPFAEVLTEDLRNLLKELEFTSLISRVEKFSVKGSVPSPLENLQEGELREQEGHKGGMLPLERLANGSSSEGTQKLEIPSGYKLVNTEKSFDEFLKDITHSPQFSFDTETTGLDIISDKPIGASFSTRSGIAYYIPFLEKDLEGLSLSRIFPALEKIFADPQKLKIAHHLKFDWQMFRNLSIHLAPPFGDTMLASFLLDSNRGSFKLDDLALDFLNIKKIPTAQLMGPKGKTPMSEVPIELLMHYACEDADCCLKLHEFFYPQLQNKNLLDLYKNVEMPLAPILARMEQDGIYVDTKVLQSISQNLTQGLNELESEIFKIAGGSFNINSPKQLQEILFEKLKLQDTVGGKKLKKTKSGYSTDVSVLEALSEHPLPNKLLDYRSLSKLKNTYTDTLPQIVHPKTHRIHTSFHQTGTATGRLSSSKPNLQNIPIKSMWGKEIRKAFSGHQEGFDIVSADYSQIELRILAHITSDQNLVNAFMSGLDIHQATAATVFKKDPHDVTPEDRNQAKAINYGIVYGMGPQRFAQSTGSTIQEAKMFIERYFQSFPRVKLFIEESIEKARVLGYSETMLGRRRPVIGLNEKGMMRVNAEHIAVNSPIQGSAADLIKLAMIIVAQKIEQGGYKGQMLLQVHDELVFECPKEETKELSQMIKHSMEHALTLKVPLVAEVGAGRNWLEAH